MQRSLADAPYTDVKRSLDSGLPVIAILPVGATEAHGPHLPLGTDVIISEAFAHAAAEKLCGEGRVIAWVLPVLAYSPAEYAANFPGTVGVSPLTMGHMLDDIGQSLHAQGFRCLALANSHFDPANLEVLRACAKRITLTGLAVAFPDATRREISVRLTDEFRTGDCHAGCYESSIVLAHRPNLVDQRMLRAAPPVQAGLLNAVRSGEAITFEKIGMTMAYCGRPAEASLDEGLRSVQILADALRDAVYSVLFSTGS